MLRLIDMDHESEEQKLYTSMRQLEKLAYLCLVPGDDYATTRRLADKLAAISEHSIDKRADIEGAA